MAKKSKIKKVNDLALIQDILHARVDLVGLGEGHGLTAAQLAHWALQEPNRRVLSGLCVLADMQTQVLLSRYRLVAASRLIKLATEDDQATADVARRACVDLLKLELKRADELPLEDTDPIDPDASHPTRGLLEVLMNAPDAELSHAGMDIEAIRCY